MRRTSLPATAALLALLCTPAARATPANKKALADYFGALLPARLSNCSACHAAPGPPVRNAFGARLQAVGEELKRQGKPSDIPARLDLVGKEDSDGDGVPNAAEILTGHFPGSKQDRPSAAELRKAGPLLARLAEQRRTYAWRPFEEVRRPPVPRVKNQAWLRNPIDAFIAAEHERRGLTPSPQAPKEVLLRRVYLDLVGYPPGRDELHAFLSDHTPDAYEKVVERLLASPQYGERWGRHWMDVWRYSDWDGYGAEVRNSQPHIWRWRDWIVDSLNADKGYDRMVQEMLAGDELAPEDPKILPATGFLVRNWYVFSRHETLTKIIEGTGKAFLGVTLNCARCHDHKFDPISQKEYFSFRAFFEPEDIRQERIPGQPDTAKDGIPRAFDASPAAETFLLFKGDDRKPDKSQPCSPAVPACFGGAKLEIRPVPLPVGAYAPEKRPFVIDETVSAGEKAVADARSVLEQARSQASPGGDSVETVALAELGVALAEARQAALLATLKAEKLEDEGAAAKDPESFKSAATDANAAQRRQALLEARYNLLAARQALAKAQAAPAGAAAAKDQAATATVLEAAQKKLAEAEKAVPAAEQAAHAPPSTTYTKRSLKLYPTTSTGRRLALARWITDPKNPLCARVAVDHLWLRHFGRPLVTTVFDFGRNGQPPSHPALLDWLASTFMEGWSMKAMHRLMVTSATYRMCSAPEVHSPQSTVHSAGRDRTDRTDQGITHHASHITQQLPNPQSVDPDNRYLWRMNSHRMEAEAVRDSLLRLSGQLDLTPGGPDLDPKLGLTLPRRSLYFRHSMEKQVEFLATFDQVPPAECYERAGTVVPQQALALANSSLALAQARILAGKLWKLVEERPDPARTRDFLSAAWEQVLNRLPTAQERAECERFLKEQSSRLADPKAL